MSTRHASQHRSGVVDIDLELFGQLLESVELALTSQEIDEGDGDFLAVQITLKIDEMRLE